MSEENKEQLSPLYYFYSQGCGFCKKSEPIIDELNKAGYNILKLDLAEKDNQGLNNELKQKYGAQCGTPWFVDPETGNDVCGFREKDIIQKWADGEKIPAPPRPKGPMPKLPLGKAPKKEIDKWKKDYEKWKNENSHLPNLQEADALLARPRPNTEPPKPPNPQMNDEQTNSWIKEYDKWKSENEHLPNLQPGQAIIDRMKSAGQPQPQVQPQQLSQEDPILKSMGVRLDTIEDKLKWITRIVEKIQDGDSNNSDSKVDKKLTALMDHLGVK